MSLCYNKDNQEIVQLNDAVRRVMSFYEDVVSFVLLPCNNESYLDKGMGNDEIDDNMKNKLDFLLDKCDGFVVPGGTYWYNFDEYVISYAIRNKKPLLAICLGFQCLCSMFSDDRIKFDMTKRLSDDSHYGDPGDYIHSVKIVEGTLLSKILNKDSIMVNSLHHDYVDFEMKDLIISSFSSDNIIESVELENHPFLVGVQWHPEYLLDDNSKKIFDYFIKKL